jgi:uroporphyrinogen decarboxylase
VSVGEDADLIEVAEAFGHQHVTAGNVSTALLAHGKPDEITEACRSCIRRYGDLPAGFILMPACDMPVMTPLPNVDAMVEAARRFGRTHAPSRRIVPG